MSLVDVAFWVLVGGLLSYTWMKIASLAWNADRRAKVKRKFDAIVRDFKGETDE